MKNEFLNVKLLRVCDRVEQSFGFVDLRDKYGFFEEKKGEKFDSKIDLDLEMDRKFFDDLNNVDEFVSELRILLENDAYLEYLERNKSEYLLRLRTQIAKFQKLKRSKKKSLVRSLFGQYYRCMYKTTPIGYACSYQIYINDSPQILGSYRSRMFGINTVNNYTECLDSGYVENEGAYVCNDNLVRLKDGAILLYAWDSGDAIRKLKPGLVNKFILVHQGKTFSQRNFMEYIKLHCDLGQGEIQKVFTRAVSLKIFVRSKTYASLFKNSWTVSESVSIAKCGNKNKVLRIDTICEAKKVVSKYDLECIGEEIRSFCRTVLSIGDLKKGRDDFLRKCNIKSGDYSIIEFIDKVARSKRPVEGIIKMGYTRDQITTLLRENVESRDGRLILNCSEGQSCKSNEMPESASLSLMEFDGKMAFNSFGDGYGRILGRYADPGNVTNKVRAYLDNFERDVVTFVDPKGGSYLEQVLFSKYYTSEFRDGALDRNRFVPLASIFVRVTDNLDLEIFSEDIGRINLIDNVMFAASVKGQISRAIASIFSRHIYCDKLILSYLRQIEDDRIWLNNSFLLKRKSVVLNSSDWVHKMTKRLGYFEFLRKIESRLGSLFVCAKLNKRNTKPVFLDLTMPYSIYHIEKIIRECDSFVIEEVLPLKDASQANECVVTMRI